MKQTVRLDGKLQNVGRYRLVRPIGPSPFGQEHLAVHRTSGGLVAACRLLLVGRDVAGDHEKKLAAIRSLLAFSHRGLVRAVDAGSAHDWLYVAYEYELGYSLSAVLTAQRSKKGPFPVEASLHILREVLLALTYAKRNGRSEITQSHGSLDLGAVLLSADGLVKLERFGLSHVLGADHVLEAGETEPAPAPSDALAAQALLGELCKDALERFGLRASVRKSIQSLAGLPAEEITLESLSREVEEISRKLLEAADPHGISELIAGLFGARLVLERDELARILSPEAEEAGVAAGLPPPTPIPASIAHGWAPVEGALLAKRYRIIKAIGEGGMGEVVEAEHLDLGRRVAIKILSIALSRDPDWASRFRREARAAAKIGHRNIVDVTDFGDAPDGRLYYVMELLKGHTLGDHLKRRGALEQTRAIRIMLQVCDALDAVHEHGVVHRDLKPDNLVLTREGDDEEFVRVVDFGIAQDEGPSAKRVTHTGQIVGTPPYMAPEQVRGHSTDARTDVYSAGAILYELVTGHIPFDADTAVEIMTSHLTTAPVSPRTQCPERDIHPMLERVILKALEKKQEDRYQSMADMAFDLWAALEAIAEEGPRGLASERVELAHPPSTLPGAALLDSSPEREQRGLPTPLPAPHDSRRQWVVAAALVVVAGVAAGTAAVALRPAGESTIASAEPASPVPRLAEPGSDLSVLRQEAPAAPAKAASKARRRARPPANKTPEENPHRPVASEDQQRHAEARELLRQRRYVRAAYAYRVMLSRNPGDAEAEAGLGQAQLGRGNSGTAVEHLGKAVSLRPQSLRYRILLAGALLQAGRGGEARREVDEVLRREPDNESALRIKRRLDASSRP